MGIRQLTSFEDAVLSTLRQTINRPAGNDGVVRAKMAVVGHSQNAINRAKRLLGLQDHGEWDFRYINEELDIQILFLDISKSDYCRKLLCVELTSAVILESQANTGEITKNCAQRVGRFPSYRDKPDSVEDADWQPFAITEHMNGERNDRKVHNLRRRARKSNGKVRRSIRRRRQHRRS